MSLVKVKYVWRYSQLTQQSDTTDSQQHLLDDSCFTVSTVKMSRHEAIDFFMRDPPLSMIWQRTKTSGVSICSICEIGFRRARGDGGEELSAARKD